MPCPIKGCPQPAHSALPWLLDQSKTLGNGVFSSVTYSDGHTGPAAVGTYQATVLHGLAIDEDANARANGLMIAAAPDMAHALAGVVEVAERAIGALHHLGCEIRQTETTMGVVKGALIEVGDAERAYKQAATAIDTAQAALQKAGAS